MKSVGTMSWQKSYFKTCRQNKLAKNPILKSVGKMNWQNLTMKSVGTMKWQNPTMKYVGTMNWQNPTMKYGGTMNWRRNNELAKSYIERMNWQKSYIEIFRHNELAKIVF